MVWCSSELMTRIFFTALCTLLLTSCSDKGATPKRLPPEVTTITVTTQTVPADYEYVGVAQSSHLVEIRSRVEGYLEEIAFEEGTLVKRDDLLYTLDLRPFQAALDNANGILAQNEATLWNAKRTTERLKPLYEKKAASQRDLDNAIAQELSSAASVESAKAKVREAQLNLDYAIIKSPISGLSSQSNFREGALITPTGSSNLLTTISVVDPIWVNFSVSDSDILRGHEEEAKGQLKYPKDMDFTVQLVLSDGSTFPSTGSVDFADFSLNQNTGTMSVRATFPNPKLLLRPGQFVRVRVIGAIRPDAMLVPQTAVLQGKNGMFLYVVNKESKVEMRQIDAGDWYKNDWVIKAGIKPGDQVIIDGVNKVRSGQVVTIKAPEAESSEDDAQKR